MKLLKFNSVKLAIFFNIIYALIKVVLLSGLTLLVVDNLKLLVINTFILATLYCVQGIFYGLSERGKYESGCFLKLQLNEWIDQYISKKSYDDFTSKETGEYASLYVNDIPMIISLLNQRFLTMIFSTILSIFILIALFLIHPYLFIAGIIIVIIMYIAPRLYDGLLQREISRSQSSKEKFLYKMTELLHSFSIFLESKAFGYYHKKSKEVCEDYSFSIFNADNVGVKLSAFLDTLSFLLCLFMLSLTSSLVIDGKISSGFLLSSISLTPVLANSIASIMTSKSFYNSGKKMFNDKFFDVEQKYNKDYCKCFFIKRYSRNNNSIVDSKEYDKDKIERIDTQNLVVHYKNKEIKYDNICFEAGKKYILSGDSGCGKSTLLKAILGLIQSYDGNILINGRIKNNSIDLLNKIGYINQTVTLLNDTLYENISLGRNINKMYVKEILDSVGLGDFDLNYKIEEKGQNLSGGQKQRVAIARALVDNKKIYFLDEATANLDKKSATIIEELFLNTDSMVVIITHNMSSELEGKVNKVIKL